MDKKAAAKELGVSVRRVEELDRQNRLGEKRYVRGPTGKQRDFDPEAVASLKAELESVDTEAVALEAPNRQAAGLVGPSQAGALERFAQLVAERLRPADSRPVLLTRAEALEASGLPPTVFALAVKRGAIGRAFKGSATRYRRDDALSLAARQDLAELVESWRNGK